MITSPLHLKRHFYLPFFESIFETNKISQLWRSDFKNNKNNLFNRERVTNIHKRKNSSILSEKRAPRYVKTAKCR